MQKGWAFTNTKSWCRGSQLALGTAGVTSPTCSRLRLDPPGCPLWPLPPSPGLWGPGFLPPSASHMARKAAENMLLLAGQQRAVGSVLSFGEFLFVPVLVSWAAVANLVLCHPLSPGDRTCIFLWAVTPLPFLVLMLWGDLLLILVQEWTLTRVWPAGASHTVATVKGSEWVCSQVRVNQMG